MYRILQSKPQDVWPETVMPAPGEVRVCFSLLVSDFPGKELTDLLSGLTSGDQRRDNVEENPGFSLAKAPW